jgi:transcriptional regulator with XRE-family HTH domain
MTRNISEKASPSMEAFASNLVSLRKAKGLTQDELAAALGTNQQKIARWETGRSEPNIKAVLAVAEYFGVLMDEMVGRSPVLQPIERARFLSEITKGHLVTRTPEDIIAKIAEFRALDEGSVDAGRIDPLTLSVFADYKRDPDNFARVANGVKAMLDARAAGKSDITDLVSAVLGA